MTVQVENNEHKIPQKYTYENMAEHWTMQDTSIITDVTRQQRTRLINICKSAIYENFDKSTGNNSRLKVLSNRTPFTLVRVNSSSPLICKEMKLINNLDYVRV